MLKNLRTSLFLVYKAITRGSKGTLVLTILVITLVFVNIIFISSIFTGAINLSYRQAIDTYVSNLVILPAEGEDYIKKVSSLKKRISMVPGVVSCSSRYSIGATIIWDVYKNGEVVRKVHWTVKSINPEEEVKITTIHNYMVAGQYLDESDRAQVILGREISGGYGAMLEVQSLKGAKVGDEITIVFANGVQRNYKIKGIFATKFPLTDINVFITEKEMESVLGLRDRASEILVRTNQLEPEELFIERFRQIGIVDEEIRPWSDFIGKIMAITQTFDIIKGIVTFIGVLVAGVTIFIVIYIVTQGRKRHIGILKAIGMDERIIIVSYIFQALFYTVLGIGVGLAIIYFLLVPYFNENPLPMPMGMVTLVVIKKELIISVLGLIFVSIIAGFIPSWLVARENIIKAIWG